MVDEPVKSPQEEIDKLKSKIVKKEQSDVESIIKQVATRDKLERDYFEDLLEITFESATGIKRMVKARRPTKKQMLMLMKLYLSSLMLSKIENDNDMKRVTEIFDQLSNLAAALCVDKQLDDKFWSECTSSNTLQSFIGELIRLTQQGPIGEKELDSFRSTSDK